MFPPAAEETAGSQPSQDTETAEAERKAQEELAEECSGQKIQSLRDSIALLDKTGLHKQADPLRCLLGRLMHGSTQLSSRTKILLRQETNKRKAAHLKAMEEAAAADAADAKLAKEIKLVAFEVEKAKLVDKGKARDKNIELAKLKEEQAARRAAKIRLEDLLFSLYKEGASKVLLKQKIFIERLKSAGSSSSSSSANGIERLEHLAKTLAAKQPWRQDVNVPEFWPVKLGRPCRSSITGKMVSVKHKTDHLYASGSFTWELFGGKQQYSPGKPQLEQMLKKMMPGYGRLVAPRWPLDETLKECRMDVDMAWLTMTWRYSAIMPAEDYPCGLRVWPPA